MARTSLVIPDLAPPLNVFATASREMYYTLRTQMLEIFNRYEAINSNSNAIVSDQTNVTTQVQTGTPASTGKRKISASARRAIAKAQKARWAKVAAEKKAAAATATGQVKTTTARRRTTAHKKPAAMAAGAGS